MDMTNHFSNTQYDGDVHEELRIPLTDDIQPQTNSSYHTANFGRTKQDEAEHNYTVCQLHHTHIDVGLRRSKQKAAFSQRIIQNQVDNQTKNQHIKGNTIDTNQNQKNVKICLFMIVLINMTLLLLNLSAIGLSTVTYKKQTRALPEVTPISLQLDSNNNQELLLQE